MANIVDGPHYEIHASELAAWLEQQGKDRWWNVDGDPLLTRLLEFPCPADELAEELRRLSRPLLIRVETPNAKGQKIDRNQLDALVLRFYETTHTVGLDRSPWGANRFLYLGWKGASNDWLLAEDNVTTEQSQADAASKKM